MLNKDRWLAAMRSPYEPVFAHRNRRVRYRGLQKVQPGIRALTFNLKRVITPGFENIDLPAGCQYQDKSVLNKAVYCRLFEQICEFRHYFSINRQAPIVPGYFFISL